MPEKLTLDDYLEWHRANLGESLGDVDLPAKYSANTGLLHSTALTSPFVTNLSNRLVELTHAGIFPDQERPPEIALSQKPFASIVSKIHRINCVWNNRWASAPHDGWVTYSTAFNRIDDIIRAAFVTRYLDGPEIVSNAISESAGDAGLEARIAPRATDAGYYAWHTYVLMPAQVIVADVVVDITLQIEFQTTTLLQSALRDLTHKIYEQSRQATPNNRTTLRWDYGSGPFRAEYLGHTLHLVDAMLVELRDTQLREAAAANEAARGD